jgi:hypothetical protein
MRTRRTAIEAQPTHSAEDNRHRRPRHPLPVSAAGETRASRQTDDSTIDTVDIRIGIANSPRELSFESSQSAAEVEKVVSAALDSDAKFIKLSDDKGKLYIVPTASFSYLEVGTETRSRVGFVA